MGIKKIVTGLLTAMALSWATAAYAAPDNGTEFGVEDDLTVLGTGGTNVDPDMEVKGFTVFGATWSALNIPAAPGSIFARGYVEVSSGMYVAGGSTFTVGAYFTGVSSFSDVTNVHFGGGTANQVLKKAAGGGMVWANDNIGLTGMGTARRLQMVNDVGTDLTNSVFLQNALDTNITMLATSSMTVLGAFGAGGAATLGGTLGVTGAATLSNNLTVAGVTSLNGAITLGNASANLLTMNAQATFIGGSTFTTGGAYFNGVSSFSNVANVHFGGGTAGQVLKKMAGGAMQWANDDSGAGTIIGTPNRIQKIDNSGTGLVDSAFIQSGNGDTSNVTMLGSSLTVNSVTLFRSSVSVLGDASGVGLQVASGKSTSLGGILDVTGTSTFVSSMTAKGHVQLGDAAGTDRVAVNMAESDSRAANTALTIDGGGTGGAFAVKFYSGTALSAWIKKK